MRLRDRHWPEIIKLKNVKNNNKITKYCKFSFYWLISDQNKPILCLIEVLCFVRICFIKSILYKALSSITLFFCLLYQISVFWFSVWIKNNWKLFTSFSTHFKTYIVLLPHLLMSSAKRECENWLLFARIWWYVSLMFGVYDLILCSFQLIKLETIISLSKQAGEKKKTNYIFIFQQFEFVFCFCISFLNSFPDDATFFFCFEIWKTKIQIERRNSFNLDILVTISTHEIDRNRNGKILM